MLARLRPALVALASVLTLAACSGPPTPYFSQPDGSADGSSSAQPGATPTAGQTPAPGSTASAPPPANTPPPSAVPAELVGSWRATIGSGTLTKVLRADATYSETWADAAPCQAEGTLQLNGRSLTLLPKTTNCTWNAVAYRFVVEGSRLVLSSGDVDTEYKRV